MGAQLKRNIWFIGESGAEIFMPKPVRQLEQPYGSQYWNNAPAIVLPEGPKVKTPARALCLYCRRIQKPSDMCLGCGAPL